MLAFAIAVVLLIITPGPGVLSTAGVGAAYGYRPGFAYVLGLFVGTNLVALAVISGLAALVFTVPGARAILMAASVVYMLYLAGRIALAGSRVAFIESRGSPGVGSGIVLQAINPKAYAVNTALFTGFAFHPQSLVVETATKLAIINLMWVPIHLGWLWAGVTLHRLNLPHSTQRAINVGMAMAMLGVVVLAVYSTWETT